MRKGSLGIFETYTVKHSEIKKEIRISIPKTKQEKHSKKTLHRRNSIKRRDTCAVLLVRYFLNWTREELQPMDQRTRNLMTMHKALYPSVDVDREDVSRKEGERALANIQDNFQCIDTMTRRLHKKQHGERVTEPCRQHKHQQNKNNQETKMGRKKQYGHFKR